MSRSSFVVRPALAIATALLLAPPSTAQSTTRAGSLDAQSPVWNRPAVPEAVSPTCALEAEDASADGVSYATFDLTVTQAENLEAEILEEGTSTAFDPMLALYCAPFDPLAPLDNLIAVNDDQAPLNALPAFDAADGIELEPGRTYTIVVTTFDPGDFGSFHLALQSATARFVPEPDAIALGAAAVLAVAARARARRSTARAR